MPKCIKHVAIQEYHCGRLQGRTKKEAKAIAESEGISYETFRFQGEAEVRSMLSFLNVIDVYSQRRRCVNALAPFGKVKFFLSV
jgi:hypothetical protein